jgi:predicted kinase
MKLTLIRGLPGSGKSTLAKKIRAIHFEADMFFTKKGVYCYNPSLIVKAHQWCEKKTAMMLQQRRAVVVSNTFIQWWQIEPYIYLAKQYDVPVKLIEASGNYANIHAVPVEVINEMQMAYESNEFIIAKITEIIPVSRLCLSLSKSIV